MLELYHLESKSDSDELYQKEMEELISDLNIKTLAWLEKLEKNNQAFDCGKS